MAFPVDQRADIARKLCEGDGQLLSKLLALLRAAEPSSDLFIDKPLARFRGAFPLPKVLSSPPVGHLVFGRFRIVRSLGKGGMGKVFEAIDGKTGSVVAIKLIRTRGAFAEHHRIGLLKEARSVAALCHPNIVRVSDIGQVHGQLYMVMEFLEGRSLRMIIHDGAKVDFPLMFRIMSQIARALAYAHAKGVIHGDIKPDNIMVLDSGSAKLVDFGVAQQQSGLRNPEVQCGGTPAYMAPERFNTPDPTAASDIWAAGITLFECLTGRLPFLTPNEMRSALPPKIVWDSPFEGELNSLITVALAKNPTERLQNAERLAVNLDRLCAEDHYLRAESTLPASPTNAVPKQTNHETYELPDLGFIRPPEGTLETKMAVFRWVKTRRSLLRLTDVNSLIVVFYIEVTLLLAGIGLLLHKAPLVWAGISMATLVPLALHAPVTFCSFLCILDRLALCRSCCLAMRRTSSWARFAKERSEVVYGQSDCVAALKHGLWQDAAKMLSIHGQETVAAYANIFISPTRFRLDFFECVKCGDHAARLSIEDRHDDGWRPREVYCESYWRAPLQRPCLLVYFSKIFRHLRMASGQSRAN
jgi:serine/threonine protein kinase